MTAVTADLETIRQQGNKSSLPVGDAETLYAGTLLCTDSDGYAVDGEDAAGLRFAGVADEAGDNSAGSDGDVEVVAWKSGEFLFTVEGGCLQSDLDKPVYLHDNATVALLGDVDNAVYVGRIVGIESATQAWIQIEPNVEAPDASRVDKVYTFEATGVDTTAFDLSTQAALFGGSDFYVEEVLHIHGFVTVSGASDGRKVVTTDWTLASGVLSTAGDETTNTWSISILGRLLP